MAGNHRIDAKSKRGRQLINIRPKWTTNFEPNYQGDRQVKRAAKYYMVPGTAGTMIVQTRSSKERNLEV